MKKMLSSTKKKHFWKNKITGLCGLYQRCKGNYRRIERVVEHYDAKTQLMQYRINKLAKEGKKYC